MTILDDLIAAGLPAIAANPGQTPLFSRTLTLAEEDIRDAIVNPAIIRERNARIAAKNIPNWAMWNETAVYDWGMSNIGTPLAAGRTSLPATLTLTTTRLAILQILTILDAMWLMLWALARMIIAMRDQLWPDLPDS